MKKKIDWQIEFDKFVEKNRFKPFKWGSWDCVTFSVACIKAMTGEDLKPKELKWKNKTEAQKTIKEYGKTLNNSLAKACKKKGLVNVDTNYLQKGDLVVYKEESELVGIFDGNRFLTPTEDRLGAKQDVNVISAWRVNA